MTYRGAATPFTSPPGNRASGGSPNGSYTPTSWSRTTLSSYGTRTSTWRRIRSTQTSTSESRGRINCTSRNRHSCPGEARGPSPAVWRDPRCTAAAWTGTGRRALTRTVTRGTFLPAPRTSRSWFPVSAFFIIVLATRMTACFVNSVQQTGVAVRSRHDPERSDARVGFGPDLAPVRGGPGR